MFVAFGAPILRALGGSGPVLGEALAYANIALAGAILTWLLNTFASVVRGTGNMRVPSLTLLAASGLQIVLGGALGPRHRTDPALWPRGRGHRPGRRLRAGRAVSALVPRAPGAGA